MVKIGDLKEFSLVFRTHFSVCFKCKIRLGPVASTATFRFAFQISKSHGTTRGGGRGPSSKRLLKGPFFATFPYFMLPYSIIFARKFGKQHCISLEYHKTLSSSLYRRIWKSFTYMPTDKRCDVCKSSLFVSLRWQNKSADFIKLHKTDWTSQTLFSCDSHNWLQIYV